MAFSSNGAVSTPTNPGNMSLMSPGDFLRKSGGQEQLSGTPRPSAAAAKGRRRAMGFPSTAGSAPRSGGLAPTWDTQLRQALRPVGPEESLEDLRRAMADLARRLQAAEAREQARAGPGGTGNTTAEGIASSEDVSSDEDEPGTGERAPDPDPEQFSVPSRRDGQRRGEIAEDLGGAGEPTGRREPDQRRSDVQGRERHGVVGQVGSRWSGAGRDGGRRESRIRRGSDYSPKRSPPELKARFDGTPDDLPQFLLHALTHARRYGDRYEDSEDLVWGVASCLQGKAGQWYLGLAERGDPATRDLQDFVVALRRRFQDPQAEDKAKSRIKGLRQGTRGVMDYIDIFRREAGKVFSWNEETQIEYFREGLNPKLREWAVIKGTEEDLSTLEGWCFVVAKLEASLGWAAAPPREAKGGSAEAPRPGPDNSRPKRPPNPERERRRREGLCLKCGGSGHFAAACQRQGGEDRGLSQGGGATRPQQARRAEDLRNEPGSAQATGNGQDLL
ncbi:uncharacterized protein LOC143831722 [Paroedura picta]|uniref:uncharacterized protein LOC143831722 n=1 Tax=Paroedura picta TaxID=143630 RepID=UPI00405773CA